jgi:cupin superfamily acireductone dioxygenase involved in methionine salvage
MPDDLEAQLRSFGPPHTNPADEVHHVLDGAITFGFVLGDRSQALAILLPGDALRIYEGVEHWSDLTTDHRVKTILHLSRPPGYAHAYTGTERRIR